MAELAIVTDDNFQAEVLESEAPALVLFWAPWCGPCRVVAVELEQMAAERADLKIVKLDVDEDPLAAEQGGVQSLPTMILFRNGAPERVIVGSQAKTVIEKILEEHGLPAPPNPSGLVGGMAQLIPRRECTMPVSPTPQLTPATLLEPADAADQRRLYLPVFRLVEHEIGGKRTLRVRLRPGDSGWRLEVACRAVPRTGGTDQLAIVVSPVLAYTTAGGVQRELALELTAEAEDVFAAAVELPTIVDRDEVFHAMTVFSWKCRLLLRCRFDAAVPVPAEAPDSEQTYRQATHQLDVPLDFGDGLFVFNPALHPDVFHGVDDVDDQSFDLITRAVSWRGRLHQYYQEERTPHLFRFLPDGFHLTRTAQRPFVPNMRVRFESEAGSLEDMRALIEYAVAPVIDGDRLLDAAKQLTAHLPSELPAGVSGPVLEPLVVTDPAKLLLELSLPRAAADSGPAQRPTVVKNISDPFSDRISGLTVGGFQEIFDALFGSSAVVFAGVVHIGEQGGRAATSVPFVARLKQLHGPILVIEETHERDGTLHVSVTNASESPAVVRAIPVQLTSTDADRVGAARLEDIRVGDAPAAFPIELQASQLLTARVVGEDAQLAGAVVGSYDLREVDARPDPDAVWNAIFDPTVPSEYTRVIRVMAVEEWFKPHTDVSAIAIDFHNGGDVVLRPGQLEASAEIRVALKELILRKQGDASYSYTQITIRGSGPVREEKVDNLDILIPDVPVNPVA